VSPFEFAPEAGGIDVGEHDVVIIEAVPGINANSGNQNLRVVFESADGDELADWWTHTPAARWRWEELWSAAGLDFPIDGGTIDERDLVGKRVCIEVIEDEYLGRKRLKVKSVFRCTSSEPEIPVDTTALPPATDDEDDARVAF
jgi:hypothetical protein